MSVVYNIFVGKVEARKAYLIVGIIIPWDSFWIDRWKIRAFLGGVVVGNYIDPQMRFARSSSGSFGGQDWNKVEGSGQRATGETSKLPLMFHVFSSEEKVFIDGQGGFD